MDAVTTAVSAEGRVKSMKCVDCQNQGMCLDHKEQSSLIGCTSGIPQRKKQTNADRIRSMSDEELTRIILCPYDTAGKTAHIMPCVKDGNIQEMVSQEYCEKCILKWLKSEVDALEPCEPDQPAWKDQMLRKFIGSRK